jgi:prepilin-type processing-associated H-X9-DG protein
MYAQDYDETLPMDSQLTAQNGQVFWMSLIEPYIKAGTRRDASNGGTIVSEKLSIFICPDYDFPAPDPDEAGNRRGNYPAVGRYPLSSYTPNQEIICAWWDVGNAGAGARSAPASLGSIGEPAQMVLLAEGHDCCVGTYAGGSNEWTRAGRRHSDGANYSLVDGHVKWYRGGTPQYGKTADGEWTGAPICTNKYLPNGQLRPNCAGYFKPRGG